MSECGGLDILTWRGSACTHTHQNKLTHTHTHHHPMYRLHCQCNVFRKVTPPNPQSPPRPQATPSPSPRPQCISSPLHLWWGQHGLCRAVLLLDGSYGWYYSKVEVEETQRKSKTARCELGLLSRCPLAHLDAPPRPAMPRPRSAIMPRVARPFAGKNLP